MGEFIDFIKKTLAVVLGFIIIGGVFFAIFWIFLVILGWATS
jgi:preprotein translocase subunit Sss1